ncbi:MAG: SDR family NAD(P)-dependent oxidoreductase [Gammaproteobacteria bacterium]|nr:SDR family NAD(P)-dependent oxidoreductase [Gammaproteobacteria bacterium]
MSRTRATKPKTILVTGATGAIGGALALCYAESNVTLILQGRDHSRLLELKNICEGKGANVITKAIDVRDRTSYMTWLQTLSQQESLDLVIVNAGVNTHVSKDGEAEPWSEVEALVEINILAVMATVQAVLPAMRSRKKGQIALMSSLAAYCGLPLTPSYSASKAAIKTYGEALRGWLGPEGIQVNVVMPGYVSSEMCDSMPGPKPFLWTPEQAAFAIKKALAADKPRFSFPFPLNFGTWCLSVLRPRLSQWILRQLDYQHGNVE